MNMNLQKELNTIIQKALQEQTFSPEVLKDVTTLSEGYEKMSGNVKALEEEIKKDKELLNENSKEIELLTREVNKHEDLEASVLEREKNVLKREHELDVRAARTEGNMDRLSDMKWAMEVVFRNNQVKRTIHENGRIPVPVDGGGNGSCGFVNDGYIDKTTEITEG